MMRRMILASVSLAALIAVAGVSAHQAGKNSPLDQQLAKTKEKLIVEQQILLRRFNEFQQQVLQLKERLKRSSDEKDQRRARVLERVLDTAKDMALGVRFQELIDYLKKTRFKSVTEVDEAKKKAEHLAQMLQKLINIIDSDDTLDITERRKMLEQILKDIDRTIRNTKVVQANTKIGRDPLDRLKEAQDRVAKETADIRKKLDRILGKGGDGKGGAKGEAKSAGKGSGQKGAGKDAQAKGGDAKSADMKGGDGKPAQAKGGAAGKGNKGGSQAGGKSGSKSGGSKTGGSKSGSKSGGKSGSKAGGSKSGSQGGSKAGGSKSGGKAGSKAGGSKSGGKSGSKSGSQGGSKSGSKAGGMKGGKGGSKAGGSKSGSKSGSKAGSKGGQSGGQGKAKSGSKSGSQGSKGSKAGGSKSGGSSGGSKSAGGSKGGGSSGGQKGGNQNQDQEQIANAKKKVQDAEGYQESASKDIAKNKKEEAVQDQGEAVNKLEEAKKNLEELLRQLREEELERLLAALKARCEKMLRMQILVYEGTKALDKNILTRPGKKPNGIDQKESLRLADEEKLIIVEATKAIEMLEAEGSAVAFPEVFKQVREDMKNVHRRLEVVDPGKLTQLIEEDIIDTLKEMVKALEKAQQDLQKKKGGGKGGKGGQQADPKLLDLIAELKLIRSMQIQVNRRTERYGRAYEGEQADDPQIRRELRNLADRQQRIYDITERIAKGENK